MTRVRYTGSTPGSIPGWRVFQPGDEDDMLEDIAQQLRSTGLFELVEPATEQPAEPVESEPNHGTE